MDAERRELIQIQHDRFIRNWRKSGIDDRYPRYEGHIRPHFDSDYRAFRSFVEGEGVGEVAPVQCEIAYFNQIKTAGGVWDSMSDMHKVFRLHTPVEPKGMPLSLEGLQLRQSFAISQLDKFKGRLYTDIVPTEADGKPAIQYHLIVRGHPGSDSAEDTLAFLDLGRELIVDYFARSTSTAMHEVWEIE